jgi:peptidoglycan LD-endopeptidase LytH
MKKRLFIFTLFIVIWLLPHNATIPVLGATPKDWNPYSFWFHPWGKSGVHKGIDIFAKQDTPVLASESGLVIYTGNIDMGGNVVAVLGAGWRVHYYAHLSEIDTHLFTWTSRGNVIGKVGATGNATGKPPHLHYSIIRLIPNLVNITTETQGWKRMFYVNPNYVLNP